MDEPAIFIQPREVLRSHATQNMGSKDRDTELKIMEFEESALENVKQNETTEKISVWEDICRVCANMRDHTVSRTDSLPHKLCYHCATTLVAWHELVTGCLDAEKRLLQMQAEIEQKESSQLRQQVPCSNELIEGIIVVDCQSIATQKPERPSQTISNHEIQKQERMGLKYIVNSNSNEPVEATTASSELVDDPETIATQELRESGVNQEAKESSLIIDEPEDSRTTQQLDRMSENLEQCTLSQETAERSGRMRKPFKLFIDMQNISRKGIKMKIEVPSNISVAKDEEDSIWKTTLSSSIEDRLSRQDSAEEGPNSTEETFAKPEENHQKSPRNEKFEIEPSSEYKTVFAKKSEDSQSHETNPNDCASLRVKCTVCLREFSDTKDLQIHAKDHKDLPESRKIYQCVECDKSFRLKDSFVRHLRIHRDERPFTCHVCGKQFRDSGGLSRHLKDVHAKLKNFSCDMCGKSFSSKATRDDHRRTHTGERPYVCETCNKTFKSKACLYSHNKLHTNEFPHPCAYCNKKFRRRQEMLVHATTHTGEKNYSCDVCCMRFRVKTEVARHKLTHSEEKPFVCSICGLRFRQNRYLNNHIKSRHVQSWKD